MLIWSNHNHKEGGRENNTDCIGSRFESSTSGFSTRRQVPGLFLRPS